jgi:hypothetical protein
MKTRSNLIQSESLYKMRRQWSYRPFRKEKANHFLEKEKGIDLSPKEDTSGFSILMHILEIWLIDKLSIAERANKKYK